MTWWTRRGEGLRRAGPDRSRDVPQHPLEWPADRWNRFIDEGWSEEWVARRRGGDSMWVRRVGGVVGVYPGPDAEREPYFHVRGHQVFRAPAHPEGASPVQWFVLRGDRVYAGDGYPGGPRGRVLYRVEVLRKRTTPTTSR